MEKYLNQNQWWNNKIYDEINVYVFGYDQFGATDITSVLSSGSASACNGTLISSIFCLERVSTK